MTDKSSTIGLYPAPRNLEQSINVCLCNTLPLIKVMGYVQGWRPHDGISVLLGVRKLALSPTGHIQS